MFNQSARQQFQLTKLVKQPVKDPAQWKETQLQNSMSCHTEISLLCVGSSRCGKSQFLQRYTNCHEQESDYKIFTKRSGDSVVYLHELSIQNQVYLKYPYNGMIFFVDLVRYHQPKRNILKWMEQLSEHNGTNIFQIPLIVLATNTHLFSEEELHKEKCKLQRELKDLLYPHQLIFVNWEQPSLMQAGLELYYKQILSGEAAGIMSNRRTIWRLYGLAEVLRPFISYINKLSVVKLSVELWNSQQSNKS